MSSSEDLVTVLQFLERNRMKATAEMLKREANLHAEGLETMDTSEAISSVLTRSNVALCRLSVCLVNFILV